MIYSQVIARRYARGLMLSLKDNDVDQVERELLDFVELMRLENTGLKRIFLDPSFSPIDRRSILQAIAKRCSMHESLQGFLKLLLAKDRMNLIELIYAALTHMIDEVRVRARAHIESAVELSPEEVGEIKAILEEITKKTIVTTTALNKGLLGGIRVRLKDAIFDGTIKAKLEAMKRQLMHDIGH
jgi:F-type H+-transporting ATPase subunit delta